MIRLKETLRDARHSAKRSRQVRRLPPPICHIPPLCASTVANTKASQPKPRISDLWRSMAWVGWPEGWMGLYGCITHPFPATVSPKIGQVTHRRKKLERTNVNIHSRLISPSPSSPTYRATAICMTRIYDGLQDIIGDAAAAAILSPPPCRMRRTWHPSTSIYALGLSSPHIGQSSQGYLV